MVSRPVSEPTFEPLTLAEAKLHLRVDHVEEDAYITALITAARLNCEQRTGLSVCSKTYSAYADSFPAEIELPNPITSSVVGIAYLDADGSLQTLDPAQYQVDIASHPARIRPVDQWPATAERMNAVQVSYVSGFASAGQVPTPLKQWMLLAIGDMYEHRTASDRPIGAVVATATVAYSFVDNLLQPYRVLQA